MSDVCVVGVGGAGCNIANYVHRVVGEHAIAISTDMKGLDKCGITETLLIGSGGCEVYTISQAKRAAEKSFEELKILVGKHQLSIMIAGLGGATGTGVTPFVIDLTRALGGDVLVVAIIPFEFETKRRQAAEQGLKELKNRGVPVLVYDNNKELDRKHSLSDFFEKINRTITEDIFTHINQWQLLNNK